MKLFLGNEFIDKERKNKNNKLVKARVLIQVSHKANSISN